MPARNDFGTGAASLDGQPFGFVLPAAGWA